MTDTLTYAYNTTLHLHKADSRLFYRIIRKSIRHGRFFFGEVPAPFILSRCLLVLSNMVRLRSRSVQTYFCSQKLVLS